MSTTSGILPQSGSCVATTYQPSGRPGSRDHESGSSQPTDTDQPTRFTGSAQAGSACSRHDPPQAKPASAGRTGRTQRRERARRRRRARPDHTHAQLRAVRLCGLRRSRRDAQRLPRGGELGDDGRRRRRRGFATRGDLAAEQSRDPAQRQPSRRRPRAGRDVMDTTYRFEVWSLTASVVVTDPAALSSVVGIVRPGLDEVDRACSRFRSDSELSTLTPGTRRLSPMLADLVGTALDAAAASDGLVDPTVAERCVAARLRPQPRAAPRRQRAGAARARRAGLAPGEPGR